MIISVAIGHDIVSFLENDLPLSLRHARKTMHQNEIEAWEKLSKNSKYYWQCWSIKEAIYKLNMKLNICNKLLFPQINSTIYHISSENVVSYFQLRIKQENIYISIQSNKNYIVTIATNSPLPLDYKLTIEKEPNHKKQSKRLREIITDSIPNSKILNKPWKKRNGPPKIYQNGIESLKHDLSFSHDGDYISSCLLTREVNTKLKLTNL